MFLVVVVVSALEVFFVENDIFGWACLQDTCFLERERKRETERERE